MTQPIDWTGLFLVRDFLTDNVTTRGVWTLAPKKDLLISIALAQFSYEFKSSYSNLSVAAWELAAEYSERHGYRPLDSVMFLFDQQMES